MPVLFIGTEETALILDKSFRMARRASGLGSMIWDPVASPDEWNAFIETMWRYQWTRQKIELTDEIREALTDRTQGNIGLAVNLYRIVQLKAIQRGQSGGPETFDARVLRDVTDKEFPLLYGMLEAKRSNDPNAYQHYDDFVPTRYRRSGRKRGAQGEVEPSKEASIGGHEGESPAAKVTVRKPRSSPRKSAVTQAFAADDLRAIVQGPGEPYETLVAAKVVRSALADVRLT